MLALCILPGCGPKREYLASEKDDAHFQRGQKLFREGRSEEAMLAFYKVIEGHADAPESHLEVGRIYLENLNDPISAIYHFKKFLEVKPNAEESPMVRQMIETAKKAFAKTLPGGSYQVGGLERLDFMDLLKQIRAENTALKNELAKYKVRSGKLEAGLPQTPDLNKQSKVSFIPEPQNKNLLKHARFYTVEPGDTLSQISSKVYGASSYWEKIFGANRDKLDSPHGLKVGQVLKVPSLE